jgi:hypothetical protein
MPRQFRSPRAVLPVRTTAIPPEERPLYSRKSHPDEPPVRAASAAPRTPRTRRTLARLGGLAVFLAAAIGLPPAAWAPPRRPRLPPRCRPPQRPRTSRLGPSRRFWPPPSSRRSHHTHHAGAGIHPPGPPRSCGRDSPLHDRRGRVRRRHPRRHARHRLAPAPADSGIAGCTALLSGHQVAAADYPRIRSEFAASQWPDLRAAGTSYVDLAVKLRTARADGYETVSFYRRLAIACARHDQNVTADG